MPDKMGSYYWFRGFPEPTEEQLKLTLEELIQVFNQSPEMMSIATFNEGIYIDVNQTFLDTLGYSHDEVIGQKSTVLGWWLSQAEREQVVSELVASGGKIRKREVRYQNRAGEIGTGLWSADIINIGMELCLFSSLLDITDRKRMEESLRKSEELFRLLAENARDMIFRVSLRPRKVEYMSPSIQNITGYTPEDHYNDPWLIFSIVHPEDKPILMKPASMYNEDPLIIRWIARDGKIIWTEQRIRIIYDELHQPIALEGISRDITDRVLLEEHLRHTSLHDSLTGLYNRAYFEEEIKRLDSNRQQPSVAIIACDVDGLKLVNDILGHLEGDRIIKAAAQVMDATFRHGDVIARVGGDEFAALITPADEIMVQELCNRLLAAVQTYNQETQGVPLGLSVGYSVRSASGVNISEVCSDADSDMYRFKQRNRKQYRYQLLRTMVSQVEQAVFGAAWEEHINRIKLISDLLARQVKLPRVRVELLMRAAELHDIGEVGIAEDILVKAGKISDYDWNQIKQHPDNGHRIANMVPELNPIAEVILAHHERWDGNGYPNGLKGHKIPLESRIISIADAFSAMTCPHPYRAAMDETAALDELQKGAGKQFDPDLVSKLLSIYPSQLELNQS